jgi:hypothetical protein
MPSLATTTDRINVLLERISSGDHLEREPLEETLTDGYAWALELDAECGRLERRISAGAERLAYEAGEEEARELSALARLLTCKRRELHSLRELLAGLRAGAQRARVA